MDDRDDIETVAARLCCGRQQARSVLEELERQGLVTKTPKRNQWGTTDKGHRLAFYWHPPRRYRPVIQYAHGGNAVGEVFDSVPCSIFRASDDQGDRFEEATIESGVCVEYDTERLVEISVWAPDDYEDPESSSLEIVATHVSIEDAKTFAQGLNKAIAKAEVEVKRREVAAVRREVRRKEREEARARQAKKKPVRTAKPTIDAGNDRSRSATSAEREGSRGPAAGASVSRGEPQRNVAGRPPSPPVTPKTATPTAARSAAKVQASPAPPCDDESEEARRRRRSTLEAAVHALRATNRSRLGAK